MVITVSTRSPLFTVSPSFERLAFAHEALEQRGPLRNFVILPAHKNLIARRRDRFFQAEKFRVRRKINRPLAALAHDADVILPVPDELRRPPQTGSAR